MSVKLVRASAIFVILIVGWPPQISTGNLGQAWLAQYLVDLSYLLRNGVPTAGIPKADPLPLSAHFTVHNDIFSGSIAMDGLVSGFSNYFVSNATLSTNLFFNLDLIFIDTIFRGTYTLDSTLYKGVVPLTGSGPIKIEFSYIRMAANGTLIGKDQMVQLKDFDFEIKQINAVESRNTEFHHLGPLNNQCNHCGAKYFAAEKSKKGYKLCCHFGKVSAGGLLKDYGLDVVLEPALRNSLNTIIQLFKPDVQNFVNQYVQKNGNKALRNVTLSKILEIIKSLLGVGDAVQFSSKSKNLVKRDLGSSGEAIRKLWELFPIVAK